jgi:hypothetical protein
LVSFVIGLSSSSISQPARGSWFREQGFRIAAADYAADAANGLDGGVAGNRGEAEAHEPGLGDPAR